jgi:hypothetical protein
VPKFDRYTVFARLFPAIIAAAPAIALAWVLVSWHSLGLTHAIAGIALTVLLMVFADVARRRGKQIEPRLIERMGGLPSTTMLRHSDPTFDGPTKERMHTLFASKLGEPAPTLLQEQTDPAGADGFYTSAGTWLRENTRDQKHFDILFNENVTYGYRRNLFALKWPALVLNATIVVGCFVAYYYGLPQRDQADLTPVFIIALLHASYLALFSSEKAVREAAYTYARQLLLSTSSPHLAMKAPAKTRKKSAA